MSGIRKFLSLLLSVALALNVMDEAGIMNLYVVGDAGDEEDVGGHVWNYVLLDNKWYLQDTTWDGQN